MILFLSSTNSIYFIPFISLSILFSYCFAAGLYTSLSHGCYITPWYSGPIRIKLLQCHVTTGRGEAGETWSRALRSTVWCTEEEGAEKEEEEALRPVYLLFLH